MTDFKLANFLPYRLAILSSSLSGLIAKTYESRFGLSMNQWRIMVTLAEHDEMTAKDISRYTLMDKMTVSRSLRKLLQRNLIVRQLSPSDARETLLKLSLVGRNIHTEIIPLAQDYEQALLSNLTESENKQLSNLIQKLQSTIDSLQDNDI